MNASNQINAAVEMQEGAGAQVRRLFPIRHARMNFDPFVLWDHFQLQAGTGFPDHPHRGFEAITYLFNGAMQHRDSLGHDSLVTGGGAQRFTAGRGLVHSEMPVTDPTNGIQLWINLPRQLKMLEPAYQQVDAEAIPEYEIEGGRVRVIVGDNSPLQLHTPIRYLDVLLQDRAAFSEIIPAGSRALVYVVDGIVQVNGHTLEAGFASFLQDEPQLDITAISSARVMVALGAPHGEPIRQHGPFVD